MVQDTPSRKLDQYIVRFPDGMRDQLKAEAKSSGRSLNAEIIKRLQDSFDRDAADAAYFASYKPPTDAEMEAQSQAYDRYLEERGGRPDEEFPPDDAIVNAPEDFVPPVSRRQRDILKKLDLSDPDVAAAIVAAMKEAVAETMAAMAKDSVAVYGEEK